MTCFTIVLKDILMMSKKNKIKEDTFDNFVFTLSFVFIRGTDPCSTIDRTKIKKSSLTFLLLEKTERNFDHS